METDNCTQIKLHPIDRCWQDFPSGDSYVFVCQNGPAECEGNMMITCAKNLTQDEEVFMAFSNCVMEEFTAAASGLQVEDMNPFY